MALEREPAMWLFPIAAETWFEVGRGRTRATGAEGFAEMIRRGRGDNIWKLGTNFKNVRVGDELVVYAVKTPSRPTRDELMEAITEASRDPLLREQVLRRVRRQQTAFRTALMRVYGGCCVITGTDVAAVLEAAHINPHAEGGDNRSRNGLLLRNTGGVRRAGRPRAPAS